MESFYHFFYILVVIGLTCLRTIESLVLDHPGIITYKISSDTKHTQNLGHLEWSNLRTRGIAQRSKKFFQENYGSKFSYRKEKYICKGTGST